MAKLYPVVAIIYVACCSQTMPPPKAAIHTFNEQVLTATWLNQYHSAGQLAWKHYIQSENDIRVKPGFNWFGFKENNNWHFVFGYVEDYEFKSRYHYIIDSMLRLQPDNRPVESRFIQSWFRALLFTRSIVSKYYLGNVDYYIKRERDSSLHIWTLTTLDDNTPPGYCRGYHFIFDKAGSQLTSKEECPSFDKIHIDSPRQLHLFISKPGQPVLTALLYSIKYGNRFNQVVIESPVMKSTYNTKGGKLWTHSSVSR